MIVSFMFLFSPRTEINTLMSKFVKYALIKTQETRLESLELNSQTRMALTKFA